MAMLPPAAMLDEQAADERTRASPIGSGVGHADPGLPTDIMQALSTLRLAASQPHMEYEAALNTLKGDDLFNNLALRRAASERVAGLPRGVVRARCLNGMQLWPYDLQDSRDDVRLMGGIGQIVLSRKETGLEWDFGEQAVQPDHDAPAAHAPPDPIAAPEDQAKLRDTSARTVAETTRVEKNKG